MKVDKLDIEIQPNNSEMGCKVLLWIMEKLVNIIDNFVFKFDNFVFKFLDNGNYCLFSIQTIIFPNLYPSFLFFFLQFLQSIKQAESK